MQECPSFVESRKRKEGVYREELSIGETGEVEEAKNAKDKKKQGNKRREGVEHTG